MEMFFLVFYLGDNAGVVMPEKYPKDQCEKVGQLINRIYTCVPAPMSMCNTAVPDPLNPAVGITKQVPCGVTTGRP